MQTQAKQSLDDLLGGLEPRQYAAMLTAANMKEVLVKLDHSHNEERESIVVDITDSLIKAETVLHNSVLSTIAAAVVQVDKTRLCLISSTPSHVFTTDGLPLIREGCKRGAGSLIELKYIDMDLYSASSCLYRHQKENLQCILAPAHTKAEA